MIEDTLRKKQRVGKQGSEIAKDTENERKMKTENDKSKGYIKTHRWKVNCKEN